MSLFRYEDNSVWDAGCNQYVWSTMLPVYSSRTFSLQTHTCPAGQIAYFKIPVRDSQIRLVNLTLFYRIILYNLFSIIHRLLWQDDSF